MVLDATEEVPTIYATGGNDNRNESLCGYGFGKARHLSRSERGRVSVHREDVVGNVHGEGEMERGRFADKPSPPGTVIWVDDKRFAAGPGDRVRERFSQARLQPDRVRAAGAVQETRIRQALGQRCDDLAHDARSMKKPTMLSRISRSSSTLNGRSVWRCQMRLHDELPLGGAGLVDVSREWRPPCATVRLHRFIANADRYAGALANPTERR